MQINSFTTKEINSIIEIETNEYFSLFFITGGREKEDVKTVL